MALLQHIVVIMLVITMAFAHKGMVDTKDVRDVGVVYSQAHYCGRKQFLFEVKDQLACLALNQDVISIAVCKEDTKCVLYTGNDCIPSIENYALSVRHGDNTEFSTAAGNYFRYYQCSCDGVSNINTNWTLPMSPLKLGLNSGEES